MASVNLKKAMLSSTYDNDNFFSLIRNYHTTFHKTSLLFHSQSNIGKAFVLGHKNTSCSRSL